MRLVLDELPRVSGQIVGADRPDLASNGVPRKVDVRLVRDAVASGDPLLKVNRPLTLLSTFQNADVYGRRPLPPTRSDVQSPANIW